MKIYLVSPRWPTIERVDTQYFQKESDAIKELRRLNKPSQERYKVDYFLMSSRTLK